MPLQKLLSPESIAIIGASTKPGAVGNDIVKNLVSYSYSGKVYPVNPKASELYNLPCFPSVKNLPEVVDLAIVVIPAPLVVDIVKECAETGITQIVIISAGFKETGAEGKKRESDLVALVEQYGLTLLGPNCLGFIHPSLGLNASFAKQMPEAGDISFFSQSGALSTALLDMTHESLTFSHFISVGNKATLEEKDFLNYFNTEDSTKTIAFYSEGINDARSFIETGQSLTKPTIALKSGATEAGSKASSSHTGSLAGSDLAYEALFKQAGILRAHTLQDMLDTLLVTSKNTFPKGPRVAILTNAGGLGVLASDTVIEEGMTLASLEESTESALRAILPEAASSHNPVDVLGDAPMLRYQEALSLIAKDSGVDMILVIVTPQSMTEAVATAEALLTFRKDSSLPLVASFAGHDSFLEAKALLTPHIATYTMAEAGAKALGALYKLSLIQEEKVSQKNTSPASAKSFSQENARTIIEEALGKKQSQLLPIEVESLLTSYGFRFPKTVTVTSVEDAEENARLFHGPVVLKIVSPEITHKSDAGGVILNVAPENIGTTYTRLIETIKTNVPTATIKGVSIHEQVDREHGKELILGIKTEPGLGKVVLVGLGGIYVEVFHDVSVRFAPLTLHDTETMVNELKSKALLEGARGEKKIPLEPLYDALMRLSQLALDFPEIESLDINPLLVFPGTAEPLALDARISLQID
ncbi:MAG: acetate--CoA ligase family protein [Candidatus Moranbacteria bacterium]|nr:acetate--CoA ligase family protein [Candidatus Moranbacteria bacterium]